MTDGNTAVIALLLKQYIEKWPDDFSQALYAFVYDINVAIDELKGKKTAGATVAGTWVYTADTVYTELLNLWEDKLNPEPTSGEED